MTYEYRSKFGRSSFRSPRGRGTSFRGRGRGGGSDSYHSSSNRDSYSSKPSFRGSSFQSSSYRGRDDHRDSRGRGTHRYSGERDRYPSSHNRKDEESSFHRRERDVRESASGSLGRDNSHSRRSDGESDRKRMRTDMGGSFKEGYSSRRSYDEYDHPSRSFNSSSSSPYRSDSTSYGGKSFKKDFNDFKKPLPPSDRPRYTSRRPMRGGTRGRGSSSIRPLVNRITKTPIPSLLRRNPISRIKQASRLQQILRKKKQLQISRMRREREIRQRPSSSGKPSHADDSKKNSSISEEQREYDNEDVDMEQDTLLDDGPPGVSSPPHRKDPIRKELNATPEKSASQSESPKFRDRTPSPGGGFRRIALKCPHCKVECKMFKNYQTHLTTHRHKAAMEKLLFNLKQKLRRLRTEQREEQRVIDARDDNFNRTSYCKLCKLNYKQTRQEHMTSDFHVSMSEFLNSKCKICRMDFATPLLYEHHRCTLTHIKRKAFLERKGALKDKDKDEENNEDENFMVLDSVESADESNDEADPSKEKTDSPKKMSLEAKKKTTIIGSEYIKKVSIYYCKLCKLCLHYNPNRDAEEGLLSHCRTRFHLKRFSLEDAKKNKVDKNASNVKGEPGEKSAENASVEAMDANDEENDNFLVDDEVASDHKSSEDEDDSHSENRYDRFSTSDVKDITDKIKVETEDNDQPKRDADKQTNAKSD